MPTRVRAVADTMPDGDRAVEAERVADGDDPLPDAQPLGVAESAPPAAAPARRP